MSSTLSEIIAPPNISDFPTNIPHAHEIIPGVWLGNYYSSHDIEFIETAKIRCIFNCTKTLPMCKDAKTVKRFYRIPVEDNLQEIEIKRLAEYLPRTVYMILEEYKRKNPILIHCFAGV
jgi:protein tyrosine/serine phosphatase